MSGKYFERKNYEKDEKEYKEFLISQMIDKSEYSEPIAHVLVHLRDIMLVEEIDIVKKWKESFSNKIFKEDLKNPDPDNRVCAYIDSIYYLMKAKYKIY